MSEKTYMEVDSDKMEVLVDKLLTLITTINETFVDISDNMAELYKNFGGDAGEVSLSKFKELESQFPKIVKNLEGYRDDLIQVNKNYITQNTSIKVNDVEVTHMDVDTGVSNM